MLGLRKLRFVDIGTGLSMMLGTAGMLVAGALSAAEPQCTTTTSCTQAQPACCDQVFADAAARINGLYAGLNCDTCAAPATPAPACAATTAPACGSAAGGCGAAGGGGDSSAPWGLTDIFDDGCGHNHLKDNGYKLGGNLVQSYTWNWQNPSNRWNGPVTWPDRSNEYQLNQFWLFAEKATDTSKKDFDIGGRVDLLYGTNARLTTESGLETPRLNGPGIYGLAIPQFYGEVAYKKLKVKVGHFISPIGYFTVDTTQNFFSTIPYTYQWGEPFTHTGAMATYQFTDNFVASSGVIKGWDNFDGHNPHLGYLGTWGYTFQDKSNLAQVIVLSQEPNFYNTFTQRYYQSLVYTKPFNDKLTYVGQTDFGTQRDATVSGQRANWYGINQYMYYKTSDKWTWGANFEWWRDEEGYRVQQFLPGAAASGITGNPNGVNNLPGGYMGNFYQVTVGPRWYPTGKPNFFIRPNLRFDWFEGNINNTTQQAVSGATNQKPYDNGQKNHQGLFITDVCWTF
jgi:Putative beta-barrel porin-2, OmpL-like. bbp2